MSRIGFDKKNGKQLAGMGHLRQSISDILTTRIGTRVMRRSYGSDVQQLIDAPTNNYTFALIYAATAEALDKWEPRFKLTQLSVAEIAQTGRLSLTLEGEYLGDLIGIEGVSL